MRTMGEFTAITLMHYDANHRSRLVDYSRLLESQEPSEEPEPSAEPEGMDPVDDTPVVGVQGQENPTTEGNAEEVLSLPEGISLSLSQWALYDTYPEDGSGFALRARQGKKLLILSFSVTNTGGQDQTLDMLAGSTEFRVAVNGENAQKTMLTMLDNDLSTFRGTIPAGGSVETVLAAEVSEDTADAITSILVNLKNDSQTCTIQAQ